MADESNKSGGVGFLGLLAILFIGLKLTGFIDWSWWWVLSPIWGVFVLFLALVVIVELVALAMDKRR